MTSVRPDPPTPLIKLRHRLSVLIPSAHIFCLVVEERLDVQRVRRFLFSVPWANLC